MSGQPYDKEAERMIAIELEAAPAMTDEAMRAAMTHLNNADLAIDAGDTGSAHAAIRAARAALSTPSYLATLSPPARDLRAALARSGQEGD